MTREQEKILENNPNFTIDFLYYCDTQEHTRFNCKKKKRQEKNINIDIIWKLQRKNDNRKE